MGASIDVTGLAHFSGSVRRAVSGDLQKTMVANLYAAERPILTDMSASTFTPIQRIGISSVDTRRTRDGIELHGGAGGGLGATLFDGAEYGGRKSRRVTYATRSPLGKAYVVRRRTTMQFLPHLGREGYVFWPTVREWLDRLVKQQEAALETAIGGR